MQALFMEKDSMSLSSLMEVVKAGVESAVPDGEWVRAEISSISVNRSGHCYLELSESSGGKVVTQVRAVIWAQMFRQIAPYFSSVTGVPLSRGQQVLLHANVNFNLIYGLSLVIDDIDPDYTLGEGQRKRIETLERLDSEGLMDAQKELVLPGLPYALAVISAENAAGYRDFMRQLHDNAWGFRFRTDLFQSPMQGEACACGIADAVASVLSSGVSYDAVLVLRGGGGDLDLSCYDEYIMCSAIARCPVPVLTAIGHDKDTHICDLVANMAVKTPTALADFFLDLYASEDARIASLKQRLGNARRTRLALMQGRLDVLRSRLQASDPRRLLQKGYVLALGADDHPVSSVERCSPGDSLTLVMADGNIVTTVDKIEKYGGI